MPLAFICGCAGPALTPRSAPFCARPPWGLILFKRNVVDRAQLRALTQTFRELRRPRRRAGAGRPGGRAGAAPRAAALAGLSRGGAFRGGRRPATRGLARRPAHRP